jgi:hypothetical protein
LARHYNLLIVTAKDRLRERVEQLSEAEAEVALDYIASRSSEPGTSTKLGESVHVSHEPTTTQDRGRPRWLSGIRAMAMVPSVLMVGLFIVAYTALIIITVAVIVRG